MEKIFNPSEDSFARMKEALTTGMFDVSAKERFLTPQILTLLYTPGVADVCLQIKYHPELADVYTNRANSVAIVSTGGILNTSSRNVLPLIDWLIVQFKYYSRLDAYPFAVDPTIDLASALADLSNSFGAVLLLEHHEEISPLPPNLAVLDHTLVAKCKGVDVASAYFSAIILKNLLEEGTTGWITQSLIEESDSELSQPCVVKKRKFFCSKLAGRTSGQNSASLHQLRKGKIEVELNFHDITKLQPLFTFENFRRLAEQRNAPSKSSKLCAILTDGTAILGLGNIGPKAGLPVMEGKSTLFRHLGDVQVVPVCINKRANLQQEVSSIQKLVGNYAAVNLEDIAAPACFYIQKKLSQAGLSVFHDDQHGTAIVILAALINSARVIRKPVHDLKVLINGAGAAGISTARLLISYGVKELIVCDTSGSIYEGRPENMNQFKVRLARDTNKARIKGNLEKCLEGMDVFIGLSVAKALKPHWIKKMGPKPIIFALSNPVPQIMPDLARANGAYITASGRNDLGTQINNSLAFPGVFRAMTTQGIKWVTMPMKIAAAQAIAMAINQPSSDNIIPRNWDRDVPLLVCEALVKAKTQVPKTAKL